MCDVMPRPPHPFPFAFVLLLLMLHLMILFINLMNFLKLPGWVNFPEARLVIICLGGGNCLVEPVHL